MSSRMNAYDKAVSLLKIRSHYSGELAKKLILRGFEQAEVSEVINRLLAAGMLNDAEFVQVFLANLIRLKTFGFYGLKAKLMQRGIPSPEAEQLLKEKLSIETEKQIAQRVIDRAGKVDKIKLMQKLSRKGFRSEIINSFLRGA
jgi:regulatory protein